MVGMFNGYNDPMSIQKLDLSKWNTTNATNMNNMFRKCSKLEELILGENFIIQPSTSTSEITYNAHANAVAAINAKLPVTE